MVINIRNGKGNNDRSTVLSPSLLKDLKTSYWEYRAVKYLFEGAAGTKYRVTSVINIVDSGAKKAGILKKITPQMLRPRFAPISLTTGQIFGTFSFFWAIVPTKRPRCMPIW
ncbi:MAG: hypothetical protein MUO53_07070 [Maribacter sp.]|nr:hypothetical protein [Maribacter sp.]